MDRKELLKNILQHLDEALYAMETHPERPDEDDAIWNSIMEIHDNVETELNKILFSEIKNKID